VCRTAREKRDLVRVVRTPDGRVQLDPTGRASGRGAYLCRDAACWTGALKRGTLDRALASQLPEGLRMALTAGPAQHIMTNDPNMNDMTATPTGAEAAGEGSGGAPHGTK
jgi:predicted RNA-binding protein YlxR (DUF448 family)